MQKANFTAGRIAAFKCGAGKLQSIYWDAKTPGLGLRVTAAGAKSYVFETRFNGKTLRMTIGDTRAYTIDKAQQIAREFKTNTDHGIDPRQLKADKLEQSAKRKALETSMAANLLTPWGEYIEENTTKVREPWGERHTQDHINLAQEGGLQRKRGAGLTQEGLLLPLLTLNFNELNQSVIARWLQQNSKDRPTQTALAYRLFRAFYNWLAEHESYKDLVAPDLLATKKVKSNVPKVFPRKKSLQREQLAAWFRAVRSLPSLVQQVYLQVLLISGARREELAALKWPKVDFNNRVIELKDKVDDSRLRQIPLTPYVAGLLLDLKAMLENRLAARNQRNKTNEELSEYVFPSSAARGYIVSPTHRIYTDALAREGLNHVAAHDLRRSFSTMGEEADVADGVIKQIMGHKPKSNDTTEKHYKVRTMSRLRDKHIEIERWILEQAGIEFKPTDEKLDQAKPVLRAVK